MKYCRTILSVIVPVIVTIVVLPAIVIFLKMMELTDCLQSWPGVVFLAVTLFLYPMFLVLLGLSSLIGHAETLEIFGIKWSVTELDKVILEREKLRAKVIIVNSGLKKETRELETLLSSVQTPDSKTKRLPEEQRREVLTTSFHLAAADLIITRDELIALKQVSMALYLDRLTFYEEYKDFKKNFDNVDFKANVNSDGKIE